MANFPMSFPMNWNLDNVTLIQHNNTSMAIHANGEMKLEGSAKDAALGLVKYVVEREYTLGLVEITINKVLVINCIDGFHISYIGDKTPSFWDELSREFNRIINMRAFW